MCKLLKEEEEVVVEGAAEAKVVVGVAAAVQDILLPLEVEVPFQIRE
jgi:hypothetical protein